MYSDIQIVNAAVTKLGDVPIAAIPPRNWDTAGIFLQDNAGAFIYPPNHANAGEKIPIVDGELESGPYQDPQFVIDQQQFTEAAQVCGATYWIHRDALLAAYPWSWALRRAKLETQPGETGVYRNVFWLPTNSALGVGIRAVYLSQNSQRALTHGWTREEKGISSFYDELWADYIEDPGKANADRDFTPSFVNALMLRLCAEWAFYFTDQANLTQYYRGLAESAFTEAKRLDAQAKPSVEIAHQPFIDARYRGGSNQRAYRTG